MSKIERHKAICNELNELYIRKNHDYGDAFHLSYLEEGMAMPRIRLGDKLNRFKTLSKNDHALVGESLRDTLIDLANYAIMTIMELDEGTVSAEKIIKYKGVIMKLTQQGDGEFSIDSSYCTICKLCCNDDKSAEEEPCVSCIHSGGVRENFILNEGKVEVLR